MWVRSADQRCRIIGNKRRAIGFGEPRVYCQCGHRYGEYEFGSDRFRRRDHSTRSGALTHGTLTHGTLTHGRSDHPGASNDSSTDG